MTKKYNEALAEVQKFNNLGEQELLGLITFSAIVGHMVENMELLEEASDSDIKRLCITNEVIIELMKCNLKSDQDLKDKMATAVPMVLDIVKDLLLTSDQEQEVTLGDLIDKSGEPLVTEVH